MKTKKQNTKQVEQETKSPVTVYARIPTKDASAAFYAKEKNQDESSPALDAFLMVMQHFISNTRSFTREEVHYYSRTYSLPYGIVEDLLTKWIQHMHGLGKIEIVDGCYSDSVFLNV